MCGPSKYQERYFHVFISLFLVRLQGRILGEDAGGVGGGGGAGGDPPPPPPRDDLRFSNTTGILVGGLLMLK